MIHPENIEDRTYPERYVVTPEDDWHTLTAINRIEASGGRYFRAYRELGAWNAGAFWGDRQMLAAGWPTRNEAIDALIRLALPEPEPGPTPLLDEEPGPTPFLDDLAAGRPATELLPTPAYTATGTPIRPGDFASLEGPAVDAEYVFEVEHLEWNRHGWEVFDTDGNDRDPAALRPADTLDPVRVVLQLDRRDLRRLAQFTHGYDKDERDNPGPWWLTQNLGLLHRVYALAQQAEPATVERITRELRLGKG